MDEPVTVRDQSALGPPATAAQPGHVVIAPDKFKGSLSALQVATLIRTGIHQVLPDADVRLAPVADGGEGTVEAALVAGYRPLQVTVTGPLGQPVTAVMALRDTVAVVELAQASGLQHNVGLAQPLSASSAGTGELVRAALDAGCRTVILGVGGSASTDGGAGMVQTLGARLTDAAGRTLDPGGGPLTELHRIDLTGLDPRIASTTFILASDVDNPLLGVQGAAAVFAPQKGATPEQVALLETSLQRWALVVADAVGQDFSARAGAGAAGGVGFAAMALLGATAQPGIELMLSMLGFSELLPGACLVVTGEGSLDEQSLHGKAPVGVAQAAARLGIATVAVAGRTTLSPGTLAAAGFSATHTLQGLEPDLTRCMAEPAPLVVRIGRQIATESLLPLSPTSR